MKHENVEYSLFTNYMIYEELKPKGVSQQVKDKINLWFRLTLTGKIIL